MNTDSKTRVPKTTFRHPQRNLPGLSSGQTGEGRFTNAFVRAYVSQFRRIHSKSTKQNVAYAREIPVNGYGIADFVSVFWKEHANEKNDTFSIDQFMHIKNPTIRAFEIKLNDWRGGMLQAHRYRFYSNVSILVLPIKQLPSPQKFLQTFQDIRVGLWGFDCQTNLIKNIYTPRPANPKAPCYVREALRHIQSASKALPFPGTHPKNTPAALSTHRRIPALA